MVRSDLTTRAAASEIHGRYGALFSPYQTTAAIRTLSNDDVALLFRAADLAFFFTVMRAPLDDMQLDLAELRRRGVAREGNYEKLFAALIESRRFDSARALTKLHALPPADTVPEVTNTIVRAGPTTLVVKDGGRKLERTVVDLRGSSRIVVIASPLCHFCQRAVRSIEGDAALLPLFRDHARWIVPPDESTSFSDVAQWNKDHANEQMEFAYRREEWPMVQRWETPVFYFFKDGRVVSSVSGWPVAGRKSEIRRCMKLAGLI